jgi:hypothetical protein
MEQTPTSEAITRSTTKEMPTFYGTRRFITVFKKARPQPCVTFRNIPATYGEDIVFPPNQPPSMNAAAYRLSITAYSIYPYLPDVFSVRNLKNKLQLLLGASVITS